MFSSFIIDIPSSRRNLGKAMGSILSAAILAGIFIASSTLSGCQPHEGSEEQLKADIDSFATYYYNWHFEKASKYCTPESEKWLRFEASNVHQADIDQLNKKTEDATIEITDINFHDDEVTADIHLDVSIFLQMDTLGTEAHSVSKATFVIPMTIHGGKWKVDLKAIPKKEKISQ